MFFFSFLEAFRFLFSIFLRNITINHSAVQQLPEDGDVTALSSVNLQKSYSDGTDDPYHEHLSQTFVPMRPPSGTEKEVLTHCIDHHAIQLSAASVLASNHWHANKWVYNRLHDVPSLFCFPLVQLIFLLIDLTRLLLAITLNTFWYIETGDLLGTPALGTLLWTPKCDTMLWELDRFMWSKTQLTLT